MFFSAAKSAPMRSLSQKLLSNRQLPAVTQPYTLPSQQHLSTTPSLLPSIHHAQSFSTQHTPQTLTPMPAHPLSALTSAISSTLATTSPLRLASTTLLVIKVPACYMATKKRRLSPQEQMERSSKEQKAEHRKLREKQAEPTEAKWWRANDGLWASPRAQNLHKRISGAHFRAEETVTKNEYNDYINELRANREIAVHENREKRQMGDDEPDSEDDSAFPGGPNKERRDRALLNAVTTKDKELARRKWSNWEDENARKKMMWITLIMALVFYFPLDSRNPDLPG